MKKSKKRSALDAKTPGKLGKKAPGVPKGGNPIDHGKKMKLGMRK
jgi:hypothetical protein